MTVRVDRLYSRNRLYYVDSVRTEPAGIRGETPNDLKFALRMMRMVEGWDPREEVVAHHVAYPKAEDWAFPSPKDEFRRLPREGDWLWVPSYDLDETSSQTLEAPPVYQTARTFRDEVAKYVAERLAKSPRLQPEGSALMEPAGVGLRVSIIDVGQGDSILLEVRGGETWLMDACNDAGRGHILANQLASLGVASIDRAFLSHPHDDHASGFPDLLERKLVKEIVVSENLRHEAVSYWLLGAAAEAGVPVSVIPSGASFSSAGVGFHAYAHPSRSSDRNNMSMVAAVELGSAAILLSGDIPARGRAAQCVLAQLFTGLGPKTHLAYKVSHHGSSTSPHTRFLSARAGESVSVVSVGEKGARKYGHPSRAAVKLCGQGGCLCRTDVCGSVRLNLEHDELLGTRWDFAGDKCAVDRCQPSVRWCAPGIGDNRECPSDRECTVFCYPMGRC